MKIIVTEKLADAGVEVLQQAEDIEVDLRMDISRSELLKVIDGYDAMIVRSNTEVNEELYQKAVKLRVVGRAGNGVDNIDMQGATSRGIIVVNTPDSNSVSACELTIALMLAAARNIVRHQDRLRQKVWSRSGLMGRELLGKTAGIIGLGRIGALVCARLQSFGMKVIAYDPYISDSRFAKLNAEKCAELKSLLTRADFITIHTPKTEETVGMVGAAELALTKKGVIIVNCARAGLIDEAALGAALKDGRVAAAGIDVLAGEPQAVSPLINFENVTVTPHAGADTFEAQANVGRTIAEEVLASLRGEMVTNAVNLPNLLPNELDRTKSYLYLCEVLGKFYHQLEKEPVEKIEVIYQGAPSDLETSLLTRAVLRGLFEPIMKERVNYVNATLIAQNRGVEVLEGKKVGSADSKSSVEVIISGRAKSFSAAGTVFGRNECKITQVNGYSLDLNPRPYMLVAMNEDKPGMIGQIGTILGVSKVNIATMQVSRDKHNNAMMFMAVDSVVNREVLNMIGGVDGIKKVNFVKL